MKNVFANVLKAALMIVVVTASLAGCGELNGGDGTTASSGQGDPAQVMSVMSSLQRDGSGKLTSAAGPVQEVDPSLMSLPPDAQVSGGGVDPRFQISCGNVGGCSVCCGSNGCCCGVCGGTFFCGSNC
jgi:hypothetical protein